MAKISVNTKYLISYPITFKSNNGYKKDVDQEVLPLNLEISYIIKYIERAFFYKWFDFLITRLAPGFCFRSFSFIYYVFSSRRLPSRRAPRRGHRELRLKLPDWLKILTNIVLTLICIKRFYKRRYVYDLLFPYSSET